MKEEIVLIDQGAYWAKVQEYAQNAVVQIFAQVGQFNWLQPYTVEEQYENIGSGFLINDQGYLITNAHVIEEAKYCWIHIPQIGRRPIPVEIVGICPGRDVALLRIAPGELQSVRTQLSTIPFLQFGDSDAVRRTETVLALGYPLAQYRLKSGTGIISGREILEGQALFQITAPVNMGSSGGPLLNIQGQVIGITVAMVPEANNIGYAIPINDLGMVLEELYTTPLVHQPGLGARFSYATSEQADFLGNPLPAGLYVSKVFKNSLFEAIGVEDGDMLYEFNGYHIDAYGDAQVPWSTDRTILHDLVARIKKDAQVTMVMYRKGEKKEFKFKFALTKLNPIRMIYPAYEPISYEMLGGLVVMELRENHLELIGLVSPHLAKYFEQENKHESVLIITHILPGSYAHQVGILSVGDVITEVNGKKVKKLVDYKRALKSAADTGFVRLKMHNGAMVVFSLDRILDEEERLSEDYAYPVSRTLASLARARTKSTE
jgi:serine protease Do